MKNLQMFCITLNPKHLTIIKDLNYLPVGLGDNKFSDEWFNDKKGDNISIKNPFYGEYTFHYWLWKNYLDKIDNNWIGFCQYRKFWIEKKLNKNFSYNEFKNAVIKNLEKYKDYDVILGEPFFAAKCKAVFPSLSFTVASATRCSNNSTILGEPFFAAKCKAVFPSLSFTVASAPRCSNNSTILV